MSDSDYIFAPRANTAAKANQQRIAVTSASGATALAANLAHQGWLSFKALGGSIDFTIGEASGTLVKDAVGIGSTVGYTLADGQERDFYVALAGAAGFVTAIGSGNCNLLITRAGVARIGVQP